MPTPHEISAFQELVFELKEPIVMPYEHWQAYSPYITNIYSRVRKGELTRKHTITESWSCMEKKRSGPAPSKGLGLRNKKSMEPGIRCGVTVSVEIVYDELDMPLNVTLRKANSKNKWEQHTHTLDLLLTRKPLSDGLKAEIVAELSSGLTAAEAVKVIRQRHAVQGRAMANLTRHHGHSCRELLLNGSASSPNNTDITIDPATSPTSTAPRPKPPRTKHQGDSRPQGEPVDLSRPCFFPPNETATGRLVQLIPLRLEHAEDLFTSIGGAKHASLYLYLPYGPFPTYEPFRQHIAQMASHKDPQMYTIKDLQTGKLVGVLSYLRMDTANRVIEIGHIMYSPLLQRTRQASEAFYLLASKAFAYGYRRLEWKCDSHNAASRRAALRYGHTFEGVFRQHMIRKGRNRDSAWFSMLDHEWPSCERAFVEWMNPGNFDEHGQQRRPLESFRVVDVAEEGENEEMEEMQEVEGDESGFGGEWMSGGMV